MVLLPRTTAVLYVDTELSDLIQHSFFSLSVKVMCFGKKTLCGYIYCCKLFSQDVTNYVTQWYAVCCIKLHFYSFFCHQILGSSVAKCLAEASRKHYTSIAFPVLGIGNLGYPPATVAETMLDAIDQFQQKTPSTSLRNASIVIYYADKGNLQVKYLVNNLTLCSKYACAHIFFLNLQHQSFVLFFLWKRYVSDGVCWFFSSWYFCFHYKHIFYYACKRKKCQ